MERWQSALTKRRENRSSEPKSTIRSMAYLTLASPILCTSLASVLATNSTNFTKQSSLRLILNALTICTTTTTNQKNTGIRSN